MNSEIGLDLVFPPEYLRAALVISLLSVWVLVGLFYYLNRYTKRVYFSIWTAAWLFYALWLTLNMSVPVAVETPFVFMVKQWSVGTAAVFLLWGSAQFLNLRTQQSLLTLFMVFLFVWSYVGAYHLDDPLAIRLPIFGLLGSASLFTAWCYFKFRREQNYVGAGLLGFGFSLWGLYLIGHPFMQDSENLAAAGFFITAVIQLFIAVSMIILVLEEARNRTLQAMEQIRSHKSETDFLHSKVVAAEERYRSLFDQASEGIIITTTDDLRILELNQAAKRFLGISRLDNTIQPLHTFCEIAKSAKAPKTGSEWYAFLRQRRQMSLVRRDGGATSVEVDGAIIKFEGRPAFQFFLREMTERAKLEQQLRQAEKLSALGQMISGVAHELNNPLAVIKGYVDLILSRHELKETTRADLEKVAQESNRAAKLVSNFLSFAREQPAHRSMADLNELVRRVTSLRQFNIRVAAVDLALELDPKLPQTLTDADQIQQVLLNLINNAIQAMLEAPLPRVLTIQSTIKDNLITLAVQDNGPGVPPDIIARIFEPFFTTKEVGTGTGLGLSIAHSILTDHQGRIFYENAPKGGARFVMEIPVQELPVAPAVPEKRETEAVDALPPIDPHSVKILILDDEKSIAELLGEMLGLLGYQPTLSNSAPLALELVRDNDYDVILSDFRMPIMDGRQFYEQAVRLKPRLARRIIFLTGDVVNEDTLEFIESTGTLHLAKPFQLKRIEESVEKILRESTWSGNNPNSI
ncbi:MAG TPA: ATP-binding protein [Roseimicrobium sp.]|nr:ATP-binding protein [Roseimicrobium sp.]